MGNAPTFYLWINGKAHEGASNIEVHNPFSGATVATVAMAGQPHIRQAVQGCHRAFAKLKSLPRAERAHLLSSIADGLRDSTTEIVDTLVLEGGKPRMFAEQELARTLSVFSWAAEEAKRFCGDVIPMDGNERGAGYEGYTRREPIGPILGICPFNFPLNLVAHKVAPALAAGNSCVIKPASATPISALIMARIASEAGVPPGCLNVLPMQHRDIRHLLEDETIRMVSFTGSPGVGWQLKSQIGKKRIALELGGNSGTIVDNSADLAWAAERCALGGFAQAGQSCIAVQRIYVHRCVYDAFLQQLTQQAAALKVGDPRKKDVTVGPVINTEAADRIMAWLEEAKKSGATVAHGGNRLDMGCGNVIEPTIVTNAKEEMRICREELFGPVVTVAPFEHIDEAIERVNDSRFGLQAAIFSNNLEQVQRAVERLEAGGVIVNDFPTYRVDHMPYGGAKDSGLGREGIRYAMREMSEEKMVVIRKGA
jgi:acyl-CoA reductase-like NAD-dependent aldehyde dehydrogenase